MKITEHEVEDIIILRVYGRLGWGNHELWTDRIKEIIGKGFRKAIISTEELPYLDSAGLGALVGSYTMMKKAGGDIIVCGLTQKVRDLLSVTKLITVFRVTENEQTAIEMFKTGELGPQTTKKNN